MFLPETCSASYYLTHSLYKFESILLCIIVPLNPLIQGWIGDILKKEIFGEESSVCDIKMYKISSSSTD